MLWINTKDILRSRSPWGTLHLCSASQQTGGADEVGEPLCRSDAAPPAGVIQMVQWISWRAIRFVPFIYLFRYLKISLIHNNYFSRLTTDTTNSPPSAQSSTPPLWIHFADSWNIIWCSHVEPCRCATWSDMLSSRYKSGWTIRISCCSGCVLNSHMAKTRSSSRVLVPVRKAFWKETEIFFSVCVCVNL